MGTNLPVEAGWPRGTLDRDYNARASVSPAAYEDALNRYRLLSDEAIASVRTRADVEYDPESQQTFDIFGTASGELRPAFLFVHGGYWRALSKADSAFMAATLATNGIATAVIDYRLAPSVSLTEIVREIRIGLAFLWKHGPSLGIDPNRIFIGGSSAGGHLAGTLLAGGWQAEFGLPADEAETVRRFDPINSIV